MPNENNDDFTFDLPIPGGPGMEQEPIPITSQPERFGAFLQAVRTAANNNTMTDLLSTCFSDRMFIPQHLGIMATICEKRGWEDFASILQVAVVAMNDETWKAKYMNLAAELLENESTEPDKRTD